MPTFNAQMPRPFAGRMPSHRRLADDLARQLDAEPVHLIFDYLRARLLPSLRHCEIRIAYRNGRFDRWRTVLQGGVRPDE